MRRVVSILGLGGVAAVAAVAGLLIGLVLAAGLPTVVGLRGFTVMSGSMEPAISTGDIVVNRQIVATAAKTGDVVTFSDPEGSGKLITHRVTSITPDGRQLRFITKGDANSGVERWSIPTGDRIGRVVYKLPQLGFYFAWTRKPFGLVGLVGVPALLLGGMELRKIWRKPDDPVDADVR